MGRCRQLTWIRRMTTTRAGPSHAATTAATTTTTLAECPGFTHATSRRNWIPHLPHLHNALSAYCHAKIHVHCAAAPVPLRNGKQYLCNRSTNVKVRGGYERSLRKWKRRRARRVNGGCYFSRVASRKVTPRGDMRGEKGSNSI